MCGLGVGDGGYIDFLWEMVSRASVGVGWRPSAGAREGSYKDWTRWLEQTQGVDLAATFVFAQNATCSRFIKSSALSH